MQGSGVALRIRGKSGKLGLREPEMQVDPYAGSLCVPLCEIPGEAEETIIT